MHAHGVKILDRANDDAVIAGVAYDFHLVFFPAKDRLLDQELAGRRGLESTFANGNELLLVVGHTATTAAECERRADDHRKADHALHLLCFL